MKVFWGMCASCARWNPKSVGNCNLAKDVGNMQKKYEKDGAFKIMVCDCYLHVPIEEAFPLEPEVKEEVVEEKPKKKGKKKE